MNKKFQISQIPKMTVAQILSAWPAVVRYFMGHGYHCMGCAMADFETLDDVAAEYKTDRNALRKDVEKIAKDSSKD